MLGSHRAVVVMFMSAPCRMIDPVFEEPAQARSIWLLGWGRWFAREHGVAAMAIFYLLLDGKVRDSVPIS